MSPSTKSRFARLRSRTALQIENDALRTAKHQMKRDNAELNAENLRLRQLLANEHRADRGTVAGTLSSQMRDADKLLADARWILGGRKRSERPDAGGLNG